jgi:hypothetical protein
MDVLSAGASTFNQHGRNAMRRLASLLSFALTFAIGVSFALLPVWFTVPTVAERLRPAFSKEEASEKVGRRVYCSYNTKELSTGKCSEKDGRCASMRVGERGEVVGIKEVSSGDYFIIVRWDELVRGDRMTSSYSRYSYRVFITEE